MVQILTLLTNESDKLEGLRAKLVEAGFEVEVESMGSNYMKYEDPTLIGKGRKHYEGLVNISRYLTEGLRLNPEIARID